MKRLFAYIGLTMLVALTIVFYFYYSGALVVIILSMIIFAVAMLVKKFDYYKKAMITVAIVAVLSSLFSCMYTDFYYIPMTNKYLDRTVTIRAAIADAPVYSNDICIYKLDTLEINGNSEKIKIMLRCANELDAEYKDIINCKATLGSCEYPYYKSQNILYTAYSTEFYLDYTVEPFQGMEILRLPLWLREKMTHAVKTIIPGKEGDLCSAIALGDKYGLGKDLEDSFQQTGLSHIIVVSGMHLTILGFFVMWLMKGLPKTKPYNIIRFAVVSVLVVTFMGITGFTPSVVRSGITTLISAFAVVLLRSYDPINALGFAAILQTMNPYAVGDVGMLLSYSAVLGLLILYPYLHKKFFKAIGYTEIYRNYKIKEKHTAKEVCRFYCYKVFVYVIDLFLLSFSAVLFTIPLTIVFFGTLTPVGIIVSALLSLPVDILLVCTLLCSVLWYIPVVSVLAYPLGVTAYYIAQLSINIVKWVSTFHFAQIYIDSTFFGVWFVVTLLVCGGVLLFKTKTKVACSIIGVSMALFFTVNFLLYIFKPSVTSVKAYACGRGVTVTVECDEALNVLSCGGESAYKYDILEKLHLVDNKVNLLVVPSVSSTEVKYAKDILSEFDVDNILLYYMSSTKDEVYSLAKKCKGYNEFTKNQAYDIELGSNADVRVMNVDNCTYQYLKCGDDTVLIIPLYGDCLDIPEKYRKADVVVMCDVPENYELLEYYKIVWSNDEKAPDCLDNVVKIKNEPMDIFN